MEENKFDTLQQKPIYDVKNSLHTINRNLNQMKTDIVCIKSDLSIIKDYIRLKEKEKDEALKGGWWFG